jgi:hypothetical protein
VEAGETARIVTRSSAFLAPIPTTVACDRRPNVEVQSSRAGWSGSDRASTNEKITDPGGMNTANEFALLKVVWLYQQPS